MGGLRPIGSEKLQGMEKIKRMIEISRYNESTPTNINEDKSTVYKVDLADGKTYSIVREKGGYIIKENIAEIYDEYIEPIQNRKYFSSYSQALKKLNLMANEFNALFENEEGTPLLGEQKKKYKLKLGKSKSQETAPPSEAPAPEMPPPADTAPATPPPADMGGMPPAPDAGMSPDDMGGMPPAPEGDDMGEMPPAPEGDDMGEMPPAPEDDEMGDVPPPSDDEDLPEPEEGDEESSKKDEGTSFKVIQKLTGKLAQKIRKFNNNDDMDPNDVKYIINSILSALDVDLLDEDDIEEIISRLEGDTDEDEDEDGEEMPTSDEDENMGDEEPMEPSDEDMPPPPESPEGGEMKEYTPHHELDEIMSLPDAINKTIGSKFAGNVYDKMEEMGEEYGMHGARKPRHTYDHFSHGTFGESKVDKVLSKYFVQTKQEIINEEKKRLKKESLLESKLKKNLKYLKTISENVRQERAAFKYLENNPTSKLVGKTNQGNIIFQEGNIITKLTINGTVI